MRDQFRPHVQWIDTHSGWQDLADCNETSFIDINAYMNIWYVRTNLSNVDKMLAEFTWTGAGEGRMRSIGHGKRNETSTAEALDVAALPPHKQP